MRKVFDTKGQETRGKRSFVGCTVMSIPPRKRARRQLNAQKKTTREKLLVPLQANGIELYGTQLNAETIGQTAKDSVDRISGN